jgi:phage baseplate assembly protein W
MTIDPTATSITFDFTAKDAHEILQCLQTLFTTPVGTVALDRDFGMDFSVLDQPLNFAKTQYRIELTQKVRKYEPRVELKSMAFETDALGGRLLPKMVFRRIE